MKPKVLPGNVLLSDIQLSLSHLGYLPSSPKLLTLVPDASTKLPERIPFYLRQNCFRMPRDVEQIDGFNERYPCPYDLLRGKLIPRDGTYYYKGELRRIESRWGTFWQANFSNWTTPGSYQIEIDQQVSVPFAIRDGSYDRLLLAFMRYLSAQRCGCEVFGVHPACHLDDGVLDSDGSPWPVTGAWHDAGDFRKWMCTLQPHLSALALLYERRNPALPHEDAPHHNAILNEIEWGNKFFHGMITDEGQVFHDLAGGDLPTGFTYEKHWWFENFSGCPGNASDNRWTDNKPNSGDERKVRTAYNALPHFIFVETQARVSAILPGASGRRCRELAERAWRYVQRKGHDRRIILVAFELKAALELLAIDSTVVDWSHAARLVEELLALQDTGSDGLNSFWLERNGEPYRSVAFSADPSLALLRLWELRSRVPGQLTPLVDRASSAIERYIDRYLLADALSNPFGLTPYGVFRDKSSADKQLFRDCGRGFGVRTFIHPFNEVNLAHGTGVVFANHAHLLARAAAHFGQTRWRHAAEKLIHWGLGHNVHNRSLHTGIGYRHPIAYSFRIPQIPEAMMPGYIGRPDDTPYMEETNLVEFNTQEPWGVHQFNIAQAACWL